MNSKWLAGFVLLTLSTLGQATTRYTVPTNSEVREWAQARAKTHKGLHDKMDEIEDSFRIAFIPGILGSQLQIGDFTYGKDPIDARKLMFQPGDYAQSQTLNSFKAQLGPVFSKKVDIYGSGLDLLHTATGQKELVEFSYDWRNDIDKIADEFQKFAQTRLKNKRVIVVAHSMGGVVAWHWKNKYRQNRPFAMPALVTLGSPLLGSCEPARMLIDGYAAPIGSPFYEQWASHLVFGKARAATLVFPSVYQLLPAYDEKNPCVRIKRKNAYYPFNHHEPGAWLGREDYGAAGRFHTESGLSEKAYKQRIEAAVQSGKRFRMDFDPKQYDDDVYLLYSSNYDMAESYPVITTGDKWLSIEKKNQLSKRGDGRVRHESATNDGNFIAAQGGLWPLTSEHGQLLSDQSFGTFVDHFLRRLIADVKVKLLIGYAVRVPELRKEIIARGWTPRSSAGSPGLMRDPEIAQAQTRIAEHNLQLVKATATEVLGDSAPDFDDPVRALIAVADINEAGLHDNFLEFLSTRPLTQDEKVAMALYESAKVLDPGKVDPVVMNKLGALILREDRPSEAADVLFAAATMPASPHSPELAATIRGQILTNLGLAYERVGAPGAALKAYKGAVALGDFKARVLTIELERGRSDIPISTFAYKPPKGSSCDFGVC